VAIFEAIAAIAGDQAIGRLRDRIRPNPYSPSLVDQQRIAGTQAGAIRPGTSGLAGSEAEWYLAPGQGAGSIDMLPLPLLQELQSHEIPPSWFRPGDPGADRDDPTVLADFRDAPVRTDNPAWGVNTGTVPHVITARINPPTAKTPLPREVAAARPDGVPAGAVDAWDGLYEG